MTGQRAPRNVAVIDVGKTNAKVVLYDLETQEERGVAASANTVRPGPPYPHMDADAIFDFIIEALGALSHEHGLDAISISAHGACAALVDGDGMLALPVLDYEHPLPGADAYETVRPAFSQTLSPAMENGLNVGRQLFWQQHRFPEGFARARHLLFHPQYWAFRLTGVAASEVTSLGCHTDLWAPRQGGVSTLVDAMGWRHLLPPIRSAFESLGPLLPELAARIGLPGRTIPVACGIHDSNASLLPHLLARAAPFTLLSTGTWVVAFAIGGQKVELDPARNTLAHVNAFGAPVPAVSFMGGREFDRLTGGQSITPSDAALEAVLAGSVMALPPVVPGTGPFAKAQGGWRGDPAGLSPAERSAAASLYLALMAQTSIALIGAAGPIVVEGPLSRNPLFLRALAQLAGVAVLADHDGTGTCAGAACLVQGIEAARAGARLPAAIPAPAAPIPGLDAYARAWRAEHARTAEGAAAGVMPASRPIGGGRHAE